jgi:hypothetical protein
MRRREKEGAGRKFDRSNLTSWDRSENPESRGPALAVRSVRWTENVRVFTE